MPRSPEREPLTLPHLAAWRQFRGLTQRQLAEKSGVTRENIAYLETRPQPPTPQTVRKLAAALECEPHELFFSPLESGGKP